MVGHFFNATQRNVKNPFSFQFRDNINSGNIYVNTEQQSLIFTDKYIQMDFELPSTHVYGFGERLSTFNLKNGAWGMWASGSTDQSS